MERYGRRAGPCETSDHIGRMRTWGWLLWLSGRAGGWSAYEKFDGTCCSVRHETSDAILSLVGLLLVRTIGGEALVLVPGTLVSSWPYRSRPEFLTVPRDRRKLLHLTQQHWLFQKGICRNTKTRLVPLDIEPRSKQARYWSAIGKSREVEPRFFEATWIHYHLIHSKQRTIGYTATYEHLIRLGQRARLWG